MLVANFPIQEVFWDPPSIQHTIYVIKSVKMALLEQGKQAGYLDAVEDFSDRDLVGPLAAQAIKLEDIERPFLFGVAVSYLPIVVC